MTNPYVARGPLRNPEMFFGRQTELNEIASFLQGNQSVSIVGPRKIGKTSLLFHLMRPATCDALGLSKDFLFAYLDCEVLGDGTHDQIFGIFAEELSEALADRSLPPEAALDEAAARPSRLAFERALRKLNQRGLRVVLLLDEFERLSTNANLDVNFFNALRSAAGRYQLAYITASARPLIQLTYSDKPQQILSSPFFNIFAPLFLGFLAETDARQLIQRPSSAAGVSIAASLEDYIYVYAGGHPLALQVTCFFALEALTKPEALSGAQSVDASGKSGLWRVIEPRAAQELAAHYEYYWRSLSTNEQLALQHTNDLAERVASDTTLRAVLRDLVQKCLLVSDSNLYRYPSRSWASFVASQTFVAAPAPAAGGLMTGTRIGPYEVMELLGRGGMAEVYKGRHSRLERMVAIKVLPASLASEADFRARFEREARSIASLRHPNIVQMFDFGDVEGTYYMVMEYISGKDLAHLMSETNPLPRALVYSLASEVASALDYAHAQGLVHRDVKPSNVLLQGSGMQASAVLTDFGIAKMLGGDTGATKTGLMMGTLNYMAPEQIRSSGTVDGRADIYALGIMVYQMLTGRLPFDADNPGAMMLAHLQTTPYDPRQFLPSLSAASAEALLCALAKDPLDRFATAGEFIRSME